MSKSKRIVEVIIKAHDKSGSTFKNLQGKLKETLTSTKGIATAAIAVGVAFVAMAKKISASFAVAVEGARGFQRGVLEINTLLNANDAEVKTMSKNLQDLAVQFGQVDEVMARAQYNIVSSGFQDAADSISILDVASRAAIAGLTDVNTAATVITQTLNAYGKSARDAEEVAGTLFATIKGGVTTFEQLAPALSKVTATAAAADIPFNELSAAIAIMTKKGSLTAEATTALNALILSMAAASGEAKDKLDEMGISLDNGLGPALQALSAASEDSLAGIAELIPNIRAIRGAAQIATEGGKEFTAQILAMASGVNDFNTAYAIMSESYDLAVKKNEASLKRLLQLKGEAAMPGALAALEAETKATDLQTKALEKSVVGHELLAYGMGQVRGDFALLKGASKAYTSDTLAMAAALTVFGVNNVGFLVDLKAQKKAAEEAKAAFSSMLLPLSDVPVEKNMGPLRSPEVMAEEARVAARAALDAAADEWEVGLAEHKFDPLTGKWIDVPLTASALATAITDAYNKAGTDAAKKIEDDTKAAAKIAAAIDKSISATVESTKDFSAAAAGFEEDIAGIHELEARRIDMLDGYYGSMDEQQLMAANGFLSPEILNEIEVETERVAAATAENAAQQQELADIVADAGHAMADMGASAFAAMLTGEKGAIMFGRALREQVIRSIVEAIAKMAILAAMTGGGSFLINMFGAAHGGRVPQYAAGGKVRGAAAGYAIPDGPKGFDSVMIAGTPGEEVIDRSLSMGLKRFINAWEGDNYIPPSGIQTGATGGSIHLHMDIARPVGVLDGLAMGDASIIAIQQVQEAAL